jgi:alpha/beta superfamily hydrolase
MHNKVVYRIARVFQEHGYAVLRFNFRGTGLSQGEHNHGNGETDDLRAAIEFVANRYHSPRLWLAGFSFGAAVMLRGACTDDRAIGIVAAGTPISKYDFSGVAACTKPKLFIQGENDQYGAVADLERFVNQLPEPKTLRVIAGAEHFFEGKLGELASVISEFLDRYADGKVENV